MLYTYSVLGCIHIQGIINILMNINGVLGNKGTMKKEVTYCLIWIIIPIVSGGEYCSFEDFAPQCAENQILNITEATYGRMQLGRCVRETHGVLGCQMDVRSYFDQMCSGKRSCDIAIPVHNLSLELKCLGELRAYLEVEYDCVDVYTPPSGHCITSHVVHVSGHAHFLSSTVSQSSRCGVHDNPWLLQAQKGQRIQLKLTDFGWTVPPGRKSDKETCLHNYGYIWDKDREDATPICGGKERNRVIFTSKGHTIKMTFESNLQSDHSFLVEYEALGCPDFVHPPDTWLQKHNGTLTVGCITSGETWRLTCVNNNWLGSIGNCSAGYGGGVYGDGNQSQGSGWSLSDNHVVAFSIGCVTVVTCCVTVIAGYYCVKRYEMRNNRRDENVLPPRLLYDDGTLASTHSSVFYRPTYSTSSTLANHTLLLKHPGQPCHHIMPPPLVPERTTSLTRPAHKKRPSQHTVPQNNNNNTKLVNENPYFTDSVHSQSNPMFHVGQNEDVQYFVLETPRRSVTDDREQLYQSIRLQSTSSSVSD